MTCSGLGDHRFSRGQKLLTGSPECGCLLCYIWRLIITTIHLYQMFQGLHRGCRNQTTLFCQINDLLSFLIVSQTSNTNCADCTSVNGVEPVTLELRGVERDSSSLLFWNDREKRNYMNTIFISTTINTFTFLMLHKSESDLQLTSLTERWPVCSSANVSLGCMSFGAQKQRKRRHKRLSHTCMAGSWLLKTVSRNTTATSGWGTHLLKMCGR